MTDSVVVEGYVRFRDGKKWKTRWVALRKPSPVADCLVLLVFKDKSEKAQGHRERASITLEDICGLEVSGQGLEGAPYTLAVLCLTQAAVLGFDSKDTLLAWEVRVRYSLGEVHRFNVGVLPGTKLEGGAATLHICNNLLALARDNPPVIVGHWNLPDLRRYGPVPTGFVFEGGTRCGYWAGVFFLASTEGEHISFLFDCIVRGVSPNRSPFGLRPVLPDPSGGPPVPLQSEEQVTREDQDLERRLSLLSHRYSNALSVYTAGAAGDDRSLSGSSDTSDTSRSDGSVGSRLTVWAEPGPAPGTSDITAAAAAGGPVGFARLSIPSAERLSIGHGGGGGGGGGGGARPLAKPPRPLQEIGRQRSSDSGIATTGSHSSYSGSFSSYTGSLDGVPGEEYAPGAGPAPGPPPGPCTCGSASGRGPAHGHLYDTPRSVARDDDQPRPLAAAPGAEPPPLQSEESEAEGGVTGSLSPPPTPPPPPPHPGHIQAPVQSGDSRGSVVADSSQSYTSMTGCSVCPTCGGSKWPPYSSGSAPGIAAITEKRTPNEEEICWGGLPANEAVERSSEAEEKAKCELLGSSGPSRYLQEPEGAVFAFPAEGPVPERPWAGDGVTYVNIPISPTSKKQLNYMELEIQETGAPGFRGPGALLPAQRTKGGSSTRYAHIDITATETAHKVGTQHALGRQEGLHTLEFRRRGAPQ
ncbi:protein Dok-7-like isoform X3 [Gadus chalcogrammus]|uniref:protein Dok-7-like isoform X3 n=1 Tax=Gadus chalcogrammus TaxID=1042646 RepID=UPI0024C4B706|nr:protein Dok-7-like isoform X3 [Gadus chalcogrammus]